MKVLNTPGRGKCTAKAKRAYREVECEGRRKAKLWPDEQKPHQAQTEDKVAIQKSSGCPQRDSAEHEEYAGVLTRLGIAENNINNANRPEGVLLEGILYPRNLNQAYKRVKQNKGASEGDRMQAEELLQYLKDKGKEINQADHQERKILSLPVLRVVIPKEDGKKRKLGIPTAVDRGVQQAIAKVLKPIYESQFSERSYGLRPRRSEHGAIRGCRENIRDGYKYVVDMDTEKTLIV